VNKKKKLQAEMNETVNRALTANDCPAPGCHQRFSCGLEREAHRSRYPEHFNTKLPGKRQQEDALPQVRVNGKTLVKGELSK
jgi:hypothetical protein